MGQKLLDKFVVFSFLKVGGCSLIAAAAALLVGKFLIGDLTWNILFGETRVQFSRSLSVQCMQFAALGGTFLLTFFSYAWVLNVEDVLELVGLKRGEVVTHSNAD